MAAEDIAKMLRDRLEDLGWSDIYAARQAGVMASVLRRAVTTGRVRVESMVRIAQALGLEVKMEVKR
ncbi:MAG: hypothetical protein ACNA8W_05190 [Bradymonadaceae bacterium]